MALDLSRYLPLYLQEATEHLEAMTRGLLALEAGAEEADTIREVFRHAHSVKGMAASMGYERTSRLAHRLEDLLSGVRDGTLRLDRPSVDLCLAVADRLGVLVRHVGEGGEEAALAGDDEGLGARLGEAGTRLAPEGRPPADQGEGDPTPDPSETAPRTPADAEAAEPTGEAHRRLRVLVRVERSSKVPGVRGFLVLRRLASLGEVVSSVPGEAELKATGLPDGNLEVVLETAARPARVEALLGTVAELERIRVEEVAPPGPEPTLAAAPAPPVRTVRVRTDLLDGLMDGVGELLLVTERLRALLGPTAPGTAGPQAEAVDRLTKVAKGLNRQVMATRMMPLATLTDRLPRVVRETARALGKEVRLQVEGADIELDRSVLEEIDASLTHLVRNCVDHGIEGPEERRARRKAPQASLAIEARRDRDRVIVSVADDGRGFDPEALKTTAVARGHLTAAQAESLEPEEVLALACLPGLSTRSEVSETSGRGVGLDVVREAVESLGGTLEIRSTPGQGSTFVLHLPLTVAIQRLLLVTVGGQILGIPVSRILHVTEAGPEDWREEGGRPTAPFLDEWVPLLDVAAALGLPAPPPGRRPHVIFEGEGRRPAAAAVEALAGHLEAVIKPAAGPLSRLTGLSGVTLLPDGRPIFVLDLASLLRSTDIPA